MLQERTFCRWSKCKKLVDGLVWFSYTQNDSYMLHKYFDFVRSMHISYAFSHQNRKNFSVKWRRANSQFILYILRLKLDTVKRKMIEKYWERLNCNIFPTKKKLFSFAYEKDIKWYINSRVCFKKLFQAINQLAIRFTEGNLLGKQKISLFRENKVYA